MDDKQPQQQPGSGYGPQEGRPGSSYRPDQPGPYNQYGQYAQHGQLGPYGQQQGQQGQQGQYGAYQGTPPAGSESWPQNPATHRADQPKERAPKRRGLALVATTALLVGAAGGVGGAAAYSALDDDPPQAGGSVTAPLAQSGAAPSSAAPDGSVQKAAAVMLPSVVKIGVVTSQGAGSGSGIVIRSDGLILTNNHVVEAAAQGGDLTVTTNDGKTAKATIVGRDELTDLAVIRAQATGLTPARLGSSGQLAVGQQVVAIGSPFGLEATVTSGIVSALNRPVTSGGEDGDSTTVFPAVQTDAAINPGNSGGALIDLAGRVVGINSAIKTAGGNGQSQGGNIGLGFAIPIDQAKPIVDELVASGKATHARLGVQVGDAESSDGLQQGARLGEVTPGGAADKAGLKAGDVVTAVDSHAIASGDALVAAVRSHRPGEKVTVTYTRGGQTTKATATLASDGGNPTG